MLRTLYVSDLDGTLLTTSSVLSATSSRLLTQAVNEGAYVTVATARTPATVVPLLQDTLTSAPLITMTGAGLWDRKADRFVYAKTLTQSSASIVVDLCLQFGIKPFVYTLQPDMRHLVLYHSATGLNEPQRAFLKNRSGLPLKTLVPRMPQDQDYAATMLVFAIGDESSIKSVADNIRRHGLDTTLSVYPDNYSGCWLLEVFGAGVSKARAIERVKQMCHAHRVVVFGDNLNDLPMFEVADIRVAVANAMPLVKESADVVIGNNDSDAVAQYIYNDFKNNI